MTQAHDGNGGGEQANEDALQAARSRLATGRRCTRRALITTKSKKLSARARTAKAEDDESLDQAIDDDDNDGDDDDDNDGDDDDGDGATHAIVV